MKKLFSSPWIPWVLIFLGLYFVQETNYVLFHTLAELFSICVAYTVFILAWTSKKYLSNSYLVFLGIAFLFIGSLDLFHTLAFQGMNIFRVPVDATQVWIATRYLESLTLLVGLLLFVPRRGFRIHNGIVFGIYGALSVLIFLSIMVWKIFPVCLVPGVGLTPFKIISEYIISGILLLGLLLLIHWRNSFQKQLMRYLALSIILTIGSELFFTFYIDAFDISNFFGHLLKILSFWFIYKAIVKNGLEDPYHLIFQELVLREEALKQSKEKAEEANQMKSAFLAKMSHELRTPLNAMIGFSEILLEDESEVPKMEKLRTIAKSGRNLLEIINQILDYSSAKAGKLKVSVAPFPLSPMLEEVQTLFAFQAEQKGLVWETRFEIEEEKDCFLGDETRIRQVLINLLGNALKFTHKGFILFSCKEEAGRVHFSVRDSGVGIQSDQLEKIFEAFHRVQDQETVSSPGTGLGLSFSKEIVDRLGGEIRAESQRGKGSHFQFSLPLEHCSQADTFPPITLPEGDPSHIRIAWIYAIPRELRSLKANMELLGRNGVQSFFHPNSPGLFSWLLEVKPDLIMVSHGLEAGALDSLQRDFRLEPVETGSFGKDSRGSLVAGETLSRPCVEWMREWLDTRQERSQELLLARARDFEEELGETELFFSALPVLETRVQNLQTGIAQEDPGAVEKEAHSLKGVAGAVRFLELSTISGEILSQVKSESVDWKRIGQNWVKIRKLLNEVPKKARFKSFQVGYSRISQGNLSRKILIVEDNDINARIVSNILSRLSIEPAFSSNGEEALKRVKETRFDLLILDSQMPLMDGKTFLQKATQNGGLDQTRVLVLSAFPLPEIQREFAGQSVDRFLSKPFEREELEQAVQQLLSHPKTAREP